MLVKRKCCSIEDILMIEQQKSFQNVSQEKVILIQSFVKIIYVLSLLLATNSHTVLHQLLCHE